MPRIPWNGVIRSVRSLRYLDRVALLNYKEIFDNDDSSEDERNQGAIIKMQLDWRQES